MGGLNRDTTRECVCAPNSSVILFLTQTAAANLFFLDILASAGMLQEYQ